MALEDEARGRARATQTPSTTRNHPAARSVPRMVIAVTCALILSGPLIYSGWRWRRSRTGGKIYTKVQIKKLEEVLASERTDKERLQKDNEASVVREKAAQQDISDLRASNKQWELAARAFGAHDSEELDQHVKEAREKEDKQLTLLRDAIVRRDASFQDRNRLWQQLRDEVDKLFLSIWVGRSSALTGARPCRPACG